MPILRRSHYHLATYWAVIHRLQTSTRHQSCQLSTLPLDQLPADLYARTGVTALAKLRMAPSLEYLYTASRSSLQSFELAHLNHAANLRREIAVLMDQWIEETAEAMLARCMLDHYAKLHRSAPSDSEIFPSFPDSTSDLLPTPPDAYSNIVPAEPCFAVHPQAMNGTLGRKTPK